MARCIDWKLWSFGMLVVGIGHSAALAGVAIQHSKNVMKVTVTQTEGSPSDNLALASRLVENALSAVGPHADEGVKEVELLLSDGEWELSEPWVISNWKADKLSTPLRVAPLGNGRVELKGSRSGFAWQPTSAAEFRTNGSLRAAGKIFELDVRQLPLANTQISLVRRGFGRSPLAGTIELYQNGHRLPRSSWPESDYSLLNVTPGHGSVDSVNPAVPLPFDPTREPDLWAQGYWGQDFADDLVPIKGTGNGDQLKFSSIMPTYGVRDNARFRLLNVMQTLNKPGEWAAVTNASRIYVMVDQADLPDDIEVSLVPTAIHIVNSSNVTLERIDVSNTTADGIVVENGEQVHFVDGVVKNTGDAGAVVSGSRSGLTSYIIEDTGGAGIVLTGGDRKSLIPGGLFVERSLIQRFAILTKTYAAGISLSGVGNKSSENVLIDGPHQAIQFTGNQHIIDKNVIVNVATEAADVGAIYTGRDWTARGTSITGNVFLKVRGIGKKGATSIYLDDQASGIEVNSNFIIDGVEGIQVGGGRDNVVTDNIMVGIERPLYFDNRGVTWGRKMTFDEMGPLQKLLRAVPINSPGYRKLYPTLAQILSDRPGEPIGNLIERNLTIGKAPLGVPQSVEGYLKLDTNRFVFDDLAGRSLAHCAESEFNFAVSRVASVCLQSKDVRCVQQLHEHEILFKNAIRRGFIDQFTACSQ